MARNYEKFEYLRDGFLKNAKTVYIMSNIIELKRGLNIPISGTAAQKAKKVVIPDVVAVKPTDFRGLLPRLLVREGDTVLAVASNGLHTNGYSLVRMLMDQMPQIKLEKLMGKPLSNRL